MAPDGDVRMPYWLTIGLKVFVTISTLAILIMIGKVVKEFWMFLVQKVTIIVIYIAIVGALVLNAFNIWAYPAF